MLKEIKWVSQMEGEPQRRWFSDHDIDLIVWQDHRHVVGFQLCYGKTREEQALSWQASDGYSHSKVEPGECRLGWHKAAPILVPGGRFDATRVAHEFRYKSVAIEPAISNFVYSKLLEYKTTEPASAAG